MAIEGEQPYLGDLLTMLLNHLLTGMILQAPSQEIIVATVDASEIPAKQ